MSTPINLSLEYIHSLYPNPSDCVQLLIDVLVDHRKNGVPGFELNMGTFGDYNGTTCFGCAATLCIINMHDLEAAKSHIMKGEELSKFESGIDCLRLGQFNSFMNRVYPNVVIRPKHKPLNNFTTNIDDEDFDTGIKALKDLIVTLKSIGY